jgi:putative intracellular protease/amidase
MEWTEVMGLLHVDLSHIHSQMYYDPELGRILSHFHEQQKPTASLCHGPWAFLSTKVGPQREFAYKGYKITAWSDAEKFMETMLRGEITKVEGEWGRYAGGYCEKHG